MVRVSFFLREGSNATDSRKGPTTLVFSTCRYTLPVLQQPGDERGSEACDNCLQSASAAEPAGMVQRGALVKHWGAQETPARCKELGEACENILPAMVHSCVNHAHNGA